MLHQCDLQIMDAAVEVQKVTALQNIMMTGSLCVLLVHVDCVNPCDPGTVSPRLLVKSVGFASE